MALAAGAQVSLDGSLFNKFLELHPKVFHFSALCR